MIAIIKYNAGNSTSVLNAVNRLNHAAQITDDPEEIMRAQKIIFPGVGEASSAMQHLKAANLDALIPQLSQPVLGICLGMQLMCTYSEEGNTTGLDIFKSQIKKFPPQDIVPHMGWNNLEQCRGSLFNQIDSRSTDFYFIHSYYAEICNQTTGICDYILPFSAAMQCDNFYGTQFHPEKSGMYGEIILRNFLAL